MAQWIKSILLFGVFASVILILCPNKNYQKHISFVVGLLFILVMFHPIMSLLQMDARSYIDYVKNLFLVENVQMNDAKEENIIYEEMMEKQILIVLTEYGYPIRNVDVEMNSYGEVERIRISGETKEDFSKSINDYLTQLFGEEVDIRYE